jgi:proteic killer suppression protein
LARAGTQGSEVANSVSAYLPNFKIQQRAREKLKYLDSASDLRDLMMPPSNQLEGLKGDRQGQHSIRINKQWRICFIWKDGDAFDVEIADYH